MNEGSLKSEVRNGVVLPDQPKNGTPCLIEFCSSDPPVQIDHTEEQVGKRASCCRMPTGEAVNMGD